MEKVLNFKWDEKREKWSAARQIDGFTIIYVVDRKSKLEPQAEGFSYRCEVKNDLVRNLDKKFVVTAVDVMGPTSGSERKVIPLSPRQPRPGGKKGRKAQLAEQSRNAR